MKHPYTVTALVSLAVSLLLGLATAAFAQSPSGDVVISSNTAWAAGSYQLNSLVVNNGATLTVGGGSTLNVTVGITVTGSSNIVLQGANTAGQVNGSWQGAGVTLNAATVEVDAGSSINADGQGYLAGSYGPPSVAGAGPGGGPAGASAGGSYGGVGGTGGANTGAATAIYGSVTAPTDLGSGGGSRWSSGVAGSGGGAIRLMVSGTLTNNGTISANGAGASNQAGGGAGGSVWITTAALVGSGSITANGGGGSGEASGGGGRIAVYYNGTNSSFTGFATSTATGGNVGNAGANGTAGFFDTSVANYNLNVYQDFPLPPNTNLSYNAITVNAGAVLTIGGGSQVTVATALTVTGTVIAQAANNTAQVSGNWQGAGATINAASVQVNTSGAISADGQGYVAGSYGPPSVAGAGPGGGPAGSSAGGSYGGLGGIGGANSGGPAAIYGSATAPTDLGSGGGTRWSGGVPGAGGGAILLTVSGTLTNNGSISANGAGASNQAGGGAGGSVWITTGTLAGTGSISANGGAGGEAGGGGGRIAVYYTSNPSFNLALVTANGGSGGNAGAAGTVNTLGANTVLTVSDNEVLPANSTLNYTSVTINQQGSLTLGSGTTLTANEITVSGGGTFTVGRRLQRCRQRHSPGHGQLHRYSPGHQHRSAGER